MQRGRTEIHRDKRPPLRVVGEQHKVKHKEERENYCEDNSLTHVDVFSFLFQTLSKKRNTKKRNTKKKHTQKKLEKHQKH